MKKIRVIPDRAFHKLWDCALQQENREAFIRTVMNEQKMFLYRNLEIDYTEALEILKEIHYAVYIPYNELLDMCELKNSTVSHHFCIPIRTAEEWKKKNACPGYVRLYIIRTYHLLSLPKSIKFEYENIYENAKRKVYQKKPKQPIKPVMPVQKDFSFNKKQQVCSSVTKILNDTAYLDRVINKTKRVI